LTLIKKERGSFGCALLRKYENPGGNPDGKIL
jgi:hypothetical protein